VIPDLGQGVQIDGDVLLSSEFATALAAAQLAGTAVGTARVEAEIPAPGAAGLCAIAGAGALLRRRRA